MQLGLEGADDVVGFAEAVLFAGEGDVDERCAEQPVRFGGVEYGDRDLRFRVFLRLGAGRERAKRWLRPVGSREQPPQNRSQ